MAREEIPKAGTLGLAALLASMLVTGAARAGRPLGGDDGGFVPPSKPVARCEDTVAKILRKDAACLDRCTFKAARATFFKGAPFEDEPCEQACGAAFVGAANRLRARNICPPCITQLSAAAVAMANEQATDAASGLVACTGTTPLGGDDAGFVAPDKTTGKCELAVGKQLSRLDQAIIACHIKAADAAFRRTSFDEEGCEDAAERKYDRTIAKLTGCPNCLDATALKTQIGTNADVGNGLIYCASPSGAFVGEVRGAVHGRRGR